MIEIKVNLPVYQIKKLRMLMKTTRLLEFV
jgi:hypothetical protein